MFKLFLFMEAIWQLVFWLVVFPMGVTLIIYLAGFIFGYSY